MATAYGRSKCVIAATATAMLAIAFGSPAVRADDDCQIPGRQFVSVKLDTPPVVIDHSLSRAALTARSKQDNRGRDEALQSLGRTEIDIAFHTSARTATKPVGARGFCAAIFSIEITVTWGTKELIASELKPNSCMSDAVTKHEAKHVNVVRRSQAEVETRVRKAVVAAIAMPIVAATDDQASDKAREDVKAVVSSTLDAIIVALNNQQAALDNPEELGEARTICGNAAYNAAFTD
jgi:hypothetical protein